MRAGFAIFKRELMSVFVTPVAWVAGTAFLLFQGFHFYLLLSHFALQTNPGSAGPVETFFGGTVFLYLPLLIICPVLTMRLFAEERRSGTIEPLMTTPITPMSVVLGKYFAALVGYLLMWVPTLIYMLIVDAHSSVDWNVVGTGYLAVALVGAGYLAVGTMTSALTKSQLVAAVASAMALTVLFTLGLGEFIFDEGPARDLCAYLSVWSQMNDFSRGVVDSRRLVLDGSMIVLPLFIAVRAVHAWRFE